ncbi:MAG: hypothetical protein PHQ27_01895 [Victivallales bacterium]|nr:hypothetical protein [Victivallales bacterium]
MKILLLALIAALTLPLQADTELLRFVPDNIQAVVGIDTAQGWRHPAFTQFRRNDPVLDQQCRLLEKQLARFRMRPENAIGSMVAFYGGEDNFGAVFHTSIRETQFDQMLAQGLTQGAEETVRIQKQQAKGYDYYLVRAICKGRQLPDSGFTYVGANQILIAPLPQLDRIRSKIRNGALASNRQYQSQLRQINTNAPFWMAFRIAPGTIQTLAANTSAPPALMLLNNIADGAFAVTTGGHSNRDFTIKGFVTCRDAGSAKAMAQQLQLLPMACGDSRTAMRVNESLHIVTKGKTLFLRMLLPEEMQRTLMGGASRPQTAQRNHHVSGKRLR